MLLPPGQRLAKDLPRLVHVEVPGTQETQYVLVLRDLHSKGSMFSCTGFVNKLTKKCKRTKTFTAVTTLPRSL